MPIMDQIAIIAWTIVAVMALLSAFSKKCRSLLECSVVAMISICAFARAWLMIRDDVNADRVMLALGVLLAIYFILKADVSWTRAAKQPDDA